MCEGERERRREGEEVTLLEQGLRFDRLILCGARMRVVLLPDDMMHEGE